MRLLFLPLSIIGGRGVGGGFLTLPILNISCWKIKAAGVAEKPLWGQCFVANHIPEFLRTVNTQNQSGTFFCFFYCTIPQMQ